MDRRHRGLPWLFLLPMTVALGASALSPVGAVAAVPAATTATSTRTTAPLTMPPTTAPATPPTTRLTTATTSAICDPVLSRAIFVSATQTSLTYSYQAPGSAVCGRTYATTVRLFADAGHTVSVAVWHSAVGSTSGTLTFDQLVPGTMYYPTIELEGSPWGTSDAPPASTLPLGTTTTTATTTTAVTTTTTTTAVSARCSADWQTLAQWPGGFVGQFLVHNTSTVVAASWTVTWSWAGTARLTAAYSAVAGGTDTAPTLTNASWNGSVAPGGSVNTVVLGTANGAFAPTGISCALR